MSGNAAMWLVLIVGLANLGLGMLLAGCCGFGPLRLRILSGKSTSGQQDEARQETAGN